LVRGKPVRSTIRWTKSCLITCGHLPSVFARALAFRNLLKNRAANPDAR
jgi:hypothetical protein